MDGLPTDDVDLDEERAGRHAAMLCELAEIGMELARGLRGQPLEPAETAMAFSRLARAIRLTIALEDRLATQHDERRRAVVEPRAAAEEAARPRPCAPP